MITYAIREYVRQRIGALVRIARSSGVNANRIDEVKGRARDGEEPDQQIPATRYQHYGFRSSPPADSEYVIIGAGDVGQRVCIASETPGTGPGSQASGEVEVYCKHGQQLTYDKDGHATLQVASGKKVAITANGATIEITAAGKVTVTSAAGQDVQVNGGALKVARDTDPVAPTATMATLLTAIIALINAAAPGTISPAQAAALALQIGTINGGAAQFKG